MCCCMLWSVVLQVMGFSEIQGFVTRKAFGVWLLGQLVALLAALFLSMLIASCSPTWCPRRRPRGSDYRARPSRRG